MSALTSRPSVSRIPSTASAISTMPLQPHHKEASERRRARAASNTSNPLDSVIESAVRHTWIVPGAITAIVLLLWLASNPRNEANPYTPFVMLSYRIVKNGEVCYGKGKKDLMFVAFYTAFFTFLRELTMEMIIKPIARKIGLKNSKQSRFMEQCYSCVHFTVFGLFGLVHLSRLHKNRSNCYSISCPKLQCGFFKRHKCTWITLIKRIRHCLSRFTCFNRRIGLTCLSCYHSNSRNPEKISWNSQFTILPRFRLFSSHTGSISRGSEFLFSGPMISAIFSLRSARSLITSMRPTQLFR